MDEAFSLFNDGFGVKKSKDMRKEKLELQKQLNEVETPVGFSVEPAKAVDTLFVEDRSNGV